MRILPEIYRELILKVTFVNYMMRSRSLLRFVPRFSLARGTIYRSFTAGPSSSMSMMNDDSSFPNLSFMAGSAMSQVTSALMPSKPLPVSAPWFPMTAKDIDNFSRSTLDAGSDLTSDHPGFADPIYRARREEIATIARNYKGGEVIPTIDYTTEEIETWGIVWDKLTTLYKKHACSEFNYAFEELKKSGIYGRDKIPQLQDISEFCKERSGFSIRPVTGLLSGRDFLNALAFRVFFSTQYIRHHSVPLFTPEPDVCHELMGHAPLFAIPAFADFCQVIGIASLGASEEQLKQLATCFWFSVEFGMLYENGQLKAYGAGLLSSFGELQHSCEGSESDRKILPWDPNIASKVEYPITKYQPLYFAAESLEDAKERMLKFCKTLEKGFEVKFNEKTQSIEIDGELCFSGVPEGTEVKSIC